jgi:hypothetical protein
MRRILAAFVLALTLICAPGVPQIHPALVASQRQGDPNVTVWVNTDSGVYHCPGTRWYGNTKKGKYLTQGAAQSAGYRPANGSVCG